MAHSAAYVTTFRRKREGRTDYRKRLTLLRGRQPRLVVRKSLHHVLAQIVDYGQTGDHVLVSAHSRELLKHGWKAGTDNISAAYLCGMLLAKKAKAKKIAGAIADLGMYPNVKGSKLYALLKGAVDGGLRVPVDPKIVPDAKRLSGQHVAHYASLLKKDPQAYQKRFSRYLKHGLAPENLPAHVEDIKKKLV